MPPARYVRHWRSGARVSLIRRVLVVALLGVGLTISSQAYAHAPEYRVPKQKPVVQLAPKAYAKMLTLKRWERTSEWKCLAILWGKESAWSHTASNPHSTAYGIPQFLNQTWLNYGYPIRPKSPYVQIEAGLKYIKARYKTPCRAWNFWQSQKKIRGYGWY